MDQPTTTVPTPSRRFRKLPVEITAVQWDGTAAGATSIIDWLLSHGATATYVCSNPDRCAGTDGDTPHRIEIGTLEGTMAADLGDWVIRGVQGEFYPCKPGIFAETYRPADEDEDQPEATGRGRCGNDPHTTLSPGDRLAYGADADAVLRVPAVADALGAVGAVREVTPGYCGHCGRGDCSPTADQWLEQRRRAERAEATVKRVVDLQGHWTAAGPPPIGTPMARWWDRRLADLAAALAEPKEN
ncbi:hypothetical protein [Streptomyces sp. NPDC059018]